ncbi:MAG: DUF1015 family protein [Lachnospiraceae bacterium]|nr:DUF1015 family protein [Lachnospiraceae bacterium]
MAKIRPFRAIRPKNELADQIAALPYDVYDRKEAKKIVQEQPLSFLKIDRAETQFDDSVDTYADVVYEKARDIYLSMKEEGQFVQDAKPCLYLYELTMNGRAQTGIVCCASIDDYLNGTIKKHESTRADKEVDRIRHVDTMSAQTGPIFLAYHADQKLKELVSKIKEKTCEVDFTSEDQITHRVWVIDDENEIRDVTGILAGMELYIADGHHRCASAAKVGLKRREEHPGYTGEEEFNYFLSVLFPDEELLILDYNRVVKDLNGHSREETLEFLKTVGELRDEGKEPYRPKKKGECGVFMDDQWYSLTFSDAVKSDDPVKGLDVSILQDHVLTPFFSITNPREDKRIDFIGGIRGLSELERRVHEDAVIAFAMYPTQINELCAVADAGLLMPPKSTWFEPKLRSGLFIHEI